MIFTFHGHGQIDFTVAGYRPMHISDGNVYLLCAETPDSFLVLARLRHLAAEGVLHGGRIEDCTIEAAA